MFEDRDSSQHPCESIDQAHARSVLFRPLQTHLFVLVVGDAGAAQVGGRKRFVRKDVVNVVRDGSHHMSW